MDAKKSFAYPLNRSLEQRGWEQRDLSIALECSDSIVSDWACGKRVPPYNTALRAADALGVSPYWLLFAADEYAQVRDEWEHRLLRAVRHLTADQRAKVQRHFEDHYTWDTVAERDEPQPASSLAPEKIAARVAGMDRGQPAAQGYASQADGHPVPGPGTLHELCDRIAAYLSDPSLTLDLADVEAFRRVYGLVQSRFAAQAPPASAGRESSGVPDAETGITP